MRVFVAVAVDQAIKEKVKLVQEELKRANVNVKWVAMKNFHLTLYFCGEISQLTLPEIITKCGETARQFMPFEIEIKDLGTFPPYGDPRVIWTGVEKGREQLLALGEAITKLMQSLAVHKEERGMSPHLTIGRIKSTLNVSKLSLAIKKISQTSFGIQIVDKILVMESKLQPTGPEYTVLQEIFLNKKGGVNA